MTKPQILSSIRQAGVVGAGGAGFPTYEKLATKVDSFIVNGAECEPLLQCDRYLMLRHKGEVLDGVRAIVDIVGAKQSFFAVKEKHVDVIAAYRELFKDFSDIEVVPLPDIYPMGDEQVLVNQVTGRLVSPGCLPRDVGCLVSNVTTVANIARALRGTPVTRRYVTIAGFVKRQISLEVAIGTPVHELLRRAGGVTIPNPVMIAGGPLTGRLIEDDSLPITKNIGGIVVLPEDYLIINEKKQSMNTVRLQSRAACFQCRDCTRVCPRWQLGYPFQPHLIMRSANYAFEEAHEVLSSAHYCCDCGLCSLIGCQTMRLSPRRLCLELKATMPRPTAWEGEVILPDIRIEDQQVPSQRLVKRLRLDEFDHSVFEADPLVPLRVTIPLKQGIGAPAVPLVSPGMLVQEGTTIAHPQDGDLGVSVHSSIAGKVLFVSREAVTIAQ